MSQQGDADNWWQKLYEDPAGPEPGPTGSAAPADPADTLDSRFSSASVLVGEVPPPRDPAPAADTAPGPLPGARSGPLPGATPGPLPGTRPGPVPAAPSGAEPGGEGAGAAAPTGYALGDTAVPPVPPPLPPPPPPPPPAPPLPAAPPTAVVPEPRRGGPGHADPRRPAPGPAGPPPVPRPEVRHLGDRAPTYAAEPGALPVADPGALDALVPDTVLEGARYGTYTLRAASVRGDSARFRAEPRRDVLLTARFGGGDDALVLVALAGGARGAPGAQDAAAEVCRWVAAAVGRSRARLADDIRAGRRDALRSGLQRLTDRGYGRLRARAAELGLPEEGYTAGLRALLLPVDPECRTRVCFGAGTGGLFRLRAGQWEDLEPAGPGPSPAGAPAPAPAAALPGPASAPGEPAGPGFRFRATVARPGDTLLLCSGGLAEPMREEASLPAELAARWDGADPPGLAAFLADTQLRLKGYADDRTAAAVWEA
ncbi:protein phosphatase 2C domain-containing protein [Streptomyces sp. NPDC006529]|uniref:protein phosphatase 2C domain-containing protein n=1 Tax=Streptomyces sp. NPDC006529 TaxID=3157177 RepID=UPI00339DE50C